MKNRIKEYMSKNKVTPDILAKNTGIGRTTIYQILNAKSVPNTEYALRIAKYFKTSVEKLFFED